MLAFLVYPLLPAAPVNGQVTSSSAEDILAEACTKAAAENKKVFVIFHASWCGWCHKMDTSMKDPACKKFFDDQFVIRHIVVHEQKNKQHLETPGGEAFMKKYNGEGQGIPFWLIFDAAGGLLADSKIRKEGDGPGEGENSGCPATEQEVDYFIRVLDTHTTLTDQQLAVIRKRFRQND